MLEKAFWSSYVVCTLNALENYESDFWEVIVFILIYFLIKQFSSSITVTFTLAAKSPTKKEKKTKIVLNMAQVSLTSLTGKSFDADLHQECIAGKHTWVSKRLWSEITSHWLENINFKSASWIYDKYKSLNCKHVIKFVYDR